MNTSKGLGLYRKFFFHRLTAIEKRRELLLNTHDKFRNEIEEHFNDFIENELNKKRCLLEERVFDFEFSESTSPMTV
jgi:hypothetical protein